jgi:NAD(P)H-flavin reductase/ferredoxin
MGALQIRVLPYGESVSCRPGQTLLAAILEQGRYLRYGCKNGGCSTCKVLLVDGDVDQRGSSMALSSSERAEGWALLCSTIPLSDCTIDATTMELTQEEFLSGDQTSVFVAEVEGKEFLTSDICRLRMRLREPDSIKFTAGQFVNVEVPGSQEVRSFSMANPPSDRHHVELIVKLLPHGLFSGWLENSLKPGDQLRLYGPLGQLKIRLSHRPIIAIAGGSGMAPIISMLTDLAEKGNARPVIFFFGARRAKDLYFQDRIKALKSAMPVLETVFALSEEQSAECEGEIGLVTEVLARRMPSLKGYDAYLCGPPGMIEAAVPLILERGVRERNIYLDAFVPSGGQ